MYFGPMKTLVTWRRGWIETDWASRYWELLNWNFIFAEKTWVSLNFSNNIEQQQKAQFSGMEK